jgi:hypothetical protein
MYFIKWIEVKGPSIGPELLKNWGIGVSPRFTGQAMSLPYKTEIKEGFLIE